ncbi:MAG: 3-deoxy-7-phosphoheptulonate synthase [Planctomycetota bacterium]|jgi:3-deoxy-7-phosphoheptulonate synthase
MGASDPRKGGGVALLQDAVPDIETGIVPVGRYRFGLDFVIIAGPCAVEGEQQILEAARAVREAGGQMLRGGAFKPRTSPQSFQGLGKPGLEMLKHVRDETGLPIVTEVMDARQLDDVVDCADILQVGSRNMQNFTLLKELGKVDRPVLLKRGMSATLDEWLGSAEYVLSGGNRRVILCERGIRTFGSTTRNTLDLAIVPLAKERSGLPVIVDPSHATGRTDLILPMSLAAVAAGADGLLVEVHPDPARALCDPDQQITPPELAELVRRVRSLLDFLQP